MLPGCQVQFFLGGYCASAAARRMGSRVADVQIVHNLALLGLTQSTGLIVIEPEVNGRKRDEQRANDISEESGE